MKLKQANRINPADVRSIGGVKAVALLSGGLDSSLAVRMMLDQGIDVKILNFVTVFCLCTSKSKGCSESRRVADELSLDMKVINMTESLLEAAKNPKYGYGSHMNPCIDCRVNMFIKAKEYMKEIGACFIITGEVLGSRPMSQRRDAMKRIEKLSGLKGLIVRPLCAKLMDPTMPEEKGWVNREKLLAISGRSRKPQIELAGAFDMNDYPCPSGGCLLTDPGFSKRLKDLVDYGQATLENVKLLKVGRHFRLSDKVKVVVGRMEAENKRILAMATDGDRIFHVVGRPGAFLLARGLKDGEFIEDIARISARYSKTNGYESAVIEYYSIPKSQSFQIKAVPATEEELSRIRI